ncbi:MAG: type I restriction enzyme endonuclease domain-containing protein [Bryobacteraceae bacterium]
MTVSSSGNPLRMDYYRKYSEIIADYNREKDRVTIEETFAQLVDLANTLSAEQRRASEEGLSEEELALFDLLKKDNLSKTDRERVKLASQTLFDSVRRLIASLERWTEKEQTQAEVETFILDYVFQELPTPPFSDDEKQTIAKLLVKRILRKHGYAPDKQEKATQTVLEHPRIISSWALAAATGFGQYWS